MPMFIFKKSAFERYRETLRCQIVSLIYVSYWDLFMSDADRNHDAYYQKDLSEMHACLLMAMQVNE